MAIREVHHDIFPMKITEEKMIIDGIMVITAVIPIRETAVEVAP